MVGNAVPPRLAWYLAIQMKKAFADQMTISKEENSQVQQTIKQLRNNIQIILSTIQILYLLKI